MSISVFLIKSWTSKMKGLGNLQKSTMEAFSRRKCGEAFGMKYRNHLSQYGSSICERTIRTIRNSVTIIGKISIISKEQTCKNIIYDFLRSKADQKKITTTFTAYYHCVEKMQLKLKRILRIRRNRAHTISKMWDEEVKSFFMAKCLSNKSSRYFKRFKKLSVPIATVSAEVKSNLIDKYLKMRGHLNAAAFFKYYGETHKEFDSMEQCNKRNRLARKIKTELFDDINVNGLDDTVKHKTLKHQDTTSPRVNKKGSPIMFGGISKSHALTKRYKANTFSSSPRKSIIKLQKVVKSLSKKSNIPTYEYKPDKLTLRMLIVKAASL
ncbi:unnamed protein product [Moneuplotes crassus]|uniref:Uncharacterized protein n=1 Tax=Euplotes crassus TaxID=5936 RepID=A0AAD1Y032_EUPCR|nr:unnamed protein product [Moneuplotes crassus]